MAVKVTSGPAQLAVEGRAQASGRRGEIIPVRNPATGKTFRARVAGAGEAAVEVGPASPALGSESKTQQGKTQGDQ